ncbi:hypothetical protein BUALT_Bualt06G0026300 [Buddleja alternifolia]|uniref:Kinesin-like protein n=1 Tax=Buddleja alternifolia TaxID=168488 RepID=A0AAV6XCH7_9LAMI|nr:hypothetical protein BUALT_Bualt06G0026300 [Buddleja alternifolia]
MSSLGGNGGRAKSDRPPSSSSGNTSLRNNGVGAQGQSHSVRAKPAVSNPRRSVTPTSTTTRSISHHHVDPESERVRVAVRLRPKNSEDLAGADYADCVELQPELKRLKLRKNNWSSEAYRFDEVFTETASQKRVYEVVAKPVVESVLDGYNGTVMAYGQTGTGKTYTLGRLGKDDVSERGIMVRALEDIIAGTSASDSVEISYLQLYMESIQDLLAPEKINIPIVEDAKTGEVSVPGVEIVKIRNLDHFLQILQLGESNRHAANTKLNTESSRSHAILMVYIRRFAEEKDQTNIDQQKDTSTDRHGRRLSTIRKSKLLIVDLAGSERVDKSGSEGHLLEEAKFINLSLTSLGKCINALAENSSHIPIRDSKLTRLLRDSFGGSARTSLIVTIGPSSRHHAETASTIMFGQRAMKVVNTVKLKEEFDYESLCRKLETQVDHLTEEIDRQQKLRENDKKEMEKKLDEFQISSAEAEKRFVNRSESNLCEGLKFHKNSILIHQKLKFSSTTSVKAEDKKCRMQNIKEENTRLEMDKARYLKHVDYFKFLIPYTGSKCYQHQLESSTYQKILADTTQMYEEKIADLVKQIEDENERSVSAEKETERMKNQMNDIQMSMQVDYYILSTEKYSNKFVSFCNFGLMLVTERIEALNQQLNDECTRAGEIEEELESTKNLLREYQDSVQSIPPCLRKFYINLHETTTNELRLLFQKVKMGKIFLNFVFGLKKILSLLDSGDLDVQTHAVKVVANLAAEDINQERIVREGGLDALLMLVESSQNTTILRVASGAIANLAMNERNQGLITSKRGARLLANAAFKTDDAQTLRMVAGAIANLCGNEKLHVVLKDDGAIKALLGMSRSGNSDVIAQIARGLANFAKCESRRIMQGRWKGRSLLMEDGVLLWLVANLNTSSTSTRRHMELAICHLAQNEDIARDFITSGGLKELIEISDTSAREDIRNLAKKTLRSSPLFRGELRAE